MNIKLTLQDQFQQHWHNQLENSPKAINYRLFKNIFEIEHYFHILDDRDIYTFCKFRTTNHRLPVEVGRWNNVNRENRLCVYCNAEDIGDEFHYLLKCTHFSADRRKYIRNDLLQRPNVLKFGQIMSDTQKDNLIKICKFIRIINKLFVL